MSTQFTNRQWRLPNNENKDKQSNYSMDFDGSGSQYINFGTDVLVDSTSSFSISGWCYINNFNSISYPGIGRFKTDQSTGFFFGVSNSLGYEGVYFGSSSNFVLGKTSGDISGDFVGQWKHITIVFDGVSRTTLSSYKVYVDGSEVSTTNSGNFNAVANENRLGEGNGSNTYFDGKLDGISIFNYALSASQVTTLYGSSSTGIGNPMSLSPKPVATYNLGDQDAFNGADYLVPNASLQDFVFNFVPEDYINCGNSITSLYDGAFSISYWVNQDTLSTNQHHILIPVNQSGWSHPYVRLMIRVNSSGRLEFRVDEWNNVLYFTGAISSGKWQHICCTFDGTTNAGSMKIYVNSGTPVTRTSTSSSITSTTNDLFLGTRYSGGANEGLDGKLSNLSIFNYELPATGTESVESLYNYGTPPPNIASYSNLQAWYKLNATATFDGSNWSIPDDSSNSNTGTSSGMTQANLVQSDLSFTSGYSPYALDFDGTSNKITSISNSGFTINAARTFSAWIKTTDTGNYITVIQTGPDSANNNFELGTFGGFLHFSSWATYNITGNVTISDGNWHFVCITFNGSVINGYVDGNSAGPNLTNASANLATIDTPYYIGASATGNSAKYFNGSISNVAVWNTALTSSQVTEIFNSGRPSNLNNHSAYSNLVSWWQLGSNSSFNNTVWTVLDEKGTNDGVSTTNMSEVDIVNGVGYSSNGVSSGMSDNLKGDAPYSTANSLSINMDVLDRTTDIPS